MYTLILLFSLYTPYGSADMEAIKIDGFPTIEACQTEGKKTTTDMGDKSQKGSGFIDSILRAQFYCIKTGKAL
ncbi:MAG: hypothetical protein Q7S11_05030 [bacterium]|nr:hypothetical protein [bacterium]